MSFLDSNGINEEIILQQDYPPKLNTNMPSTTPYFHIADLASTQMNEGKGKLHI